MKTNGERGILRCSNTCPPLPQRQINGKERKKTQSLKVENNRDDHALVGSSSSPLPGGPVAAVIIFVSVYLCGRVDYAPSY